MIHKRHIFIIIGLFIGFLVMPMYSFAQETPPAPQFLYRSDNHLILLDGYTGKSTILPIKITNGDHFTWSPDGKYLLAQLNDGKNIRFCLNLYEIDNQQWIQDKPISCDVQDFIFTSEGSQIYYSSNGETKGVLWRYNIPDKTNQELYQTDTTANYSDGIHELKWSHN